MAYINYDVNENYYQIMKEYHNSERAFTRKEIDESAVSNSSEPEYYPENALVSLDVYVSLENV